MPCRYGCAKKTGTEEEGALARVFTALAALTGKLECPAAIVPGALSILPAGWFHITGGEPPAWAAALCGLAIVLCGLPIVVSGLRNLLVFRRIKASLLISMAVFASLAIGERFAAGEVAVIMAVGGWLEERTLRRTRRGVNALVRLLPLEARLVAPDGSDAVVKVESLPLGARLRVAPGESFPLDGRVVSGATQVDQSVMTGESRPVAKNVGDTVFCSTVNCGGAVEIETTSTFENSSVKKMIRLVKEAERNKAPVQGVADKWAARVVPGALALAVATFFLVPLVVPDAGLTVRLTRAVTILVVFCPCALALATPTAVIAAIGQAARAGVLVKSGAALEAMGHIDAVAFDKTGTLTAGRRNMPDADKADTPRESAAAAVAELRAAGVRMVMLSGDNAAAARAVAEPLGIEMRAELLPAGKADAIKALKAEGHTVAMVGDGVNDALAFKSADVGIAMGAMGSDVAIESADIALLGDDLRRIAALRRLARAALHTIKWNIAVAMTINAAAVVCSMLGVLTPATGAVVHNMTSILVVLNATRLRASH